MFASLLLMSAAALCAALATGSDSKLELEGAWKLLPEGQAARNAPLSPVRMSLKWLDSPPASASAVPAGFEQPLFTSIEILGREIRIVLARGSSESKSVDRAWFDLDGDGKPAPAELFEIEIQERKLRGGRIYRNGVVSGAELAHDGQMLPLTLAYSQSDDDAPRANLTVRWYLEGRATVGGRDYAVFFQDGDGNGRFDDQQDRFGILPVDRLGEQQLRSTALLAPGEGLFLDGHRLAARLLEGNRIELAHRAAEGPEAADLASVRKRVEHKWAERFDRERAKFVVDHELDTERPLADEPINWRWVTLDQALELSARERKPLFVDVMAFWCVWCYRMDYYTYPDAEVVRLMNERFIPVKIIQEQDPVGDYQRVRDLLKARGIPAMGIFGTDGEVRHMISGWKKPEDFLAELNQGL